MYSQLAFKFHRVVPSVLILNWKLLLSQIFIDITKILNL